MVNLDFVLSQPKINSVTFWLTVVMYEDNEDAVRLANSPLRSARPKHIGVRHHLIRNGVKAGRIVVKQSKTEGYNAAIPTKPTSLVSLAKHRQIIYRNLVPF